MAVPIAPILLSLVVPVAASGFDSAYDKAFRESFRASSIEACIEAVKSPVPAGIDLTAICACVADRIMQSKSPGDVTAVPDSEIDVTTEACFEAEVGKRWRP